SLRGRAVSLLCSPRSREGKVARRRNYFSRPGSLVPDLHLLDRSIARAAARRRPGVFLDAGTLAWRRRDVVGLRSSFLASDRVLNRSSGGAHGKVPSRHLSPPPHRSGRSSVAVHQALFLEPESVAASGHGRSQSGSDRPHPWDVSLPGGGIYFFDDRRRRHLARRE